MALKPGSVRQIPEQGILDFYNKQTYLGNSFAVSTGLVAGTGAEVPLLYINNADTNTFQNGQAGSLACFNISRKFQCDSPSAAAVFKVYLNPTTVAAGSVITPVNLRPAWGTVSKMAVKKSPTAVSNGTLIYTFVVGGAVSVDSKVLLVVDPGQALLVTQNVTAANVAVDFSWYEI